MSKRKVNPTDAELEILQVLWEEGPSTVREIYEAIFPKRGTGYTTVLKFLQMMTEKGLVLCDKSQRSHVYQALIKKLPTEKTLVKDFMEKVFSGSASQLVMRALSTRSASEEELSEIRKFLDEIEKKESNK